MSKIVDQEVYCRSLHNKQRKLFPATDVFIYIITKLYTMVSLYRSGSILIILLYLHNDPIVYGTIVSMDRSRYSNN